VRLQINPRKPQDRLKNELAGACLVTTRDWVALDVYGDSITAGVSPAAGGEAELSRLENSEKPIRRLISRLGAAEGLACVLRGGPWWPNR